MRVSDADRARTAQLLADALADGRLTPAEADERLAACWAARLDHELAELTADVPPRPTPPVPVPARRPATTGVWSGPLLVHTAIATLIGTLLIARWAMVPEFDGRPNFPGPPQFVEHGNFFWPIFPIIFLAITVLAHHQVRRARRYGD
jgi:hypothetical protein